MCLHSSPSSEGNDTYNGTPATRLTDYSPEDFRLATKAGTEVQATPRNPPLFTLEGVQSKDALDAGIADRTGIVCYDPFSSDSSVLVQTTKARSLKLSPTAEAFKPRLPAVSQPRDVSSGMATSCHGAAHACQTPATTAVGYLRATSVPDSDFPSSNRKYPTEAHESHVSLLPPSRAPSHSSNRVSASPTTVLENSGVNDGTETRYVRVHGVAYDASVDDLNSIFSVSSRLSLGWPIKLMILGIEFQGAQTGHSLRAIHQGRYHSQIRECS